MTKDEQAAIAHILNAGLIIQFADKSASAAAGARAQRDEIVTRLGELLAKDSPRFDRARWYAACDGRVLP